MITGLRPAALTIWDAKMNDWRENGNKERLYAICNGGLSLWFKKKCHLITEKGDIQASCGEARSVYDDKERSQILADMDEQEAYLVKALEETRTARRLFLANQKNESAC